MLRSLTGLLTGTPARTQGERPPVDRSSPGGTASIKPSPLQNHSPNRDDGTALADRDQALLTSALKRASQEFGSEAPPARNLLSPTPTPIELEVDEAGNITVDSDVDLPSADAVLRGEVQVRTTSKSPSKPAVIIHPPTSAPPSPPKPKPTTQQQMAAAQDLALEEAGTNKKRKEKRKKKKTAEEVAKETAEYDALTGPDVPWASTQSQVWAPPSDDGLADAKGGDEEEATMRQATSSSSKAAQTSAVHPSPKSRRQAGGREPLVVIPPATHPHATTPSSKSKSKSNSTSARSKTDARPLSPKKQPATKAKGKAKDSTRAPVARVRKTKKKVEEEEDDDEEDDEDQLGDEEEEADLAQKLPTSAGYDTARWRSYGACAVDHGDDDDEVPETIRTGDCVYVVPDDTSFLPEDGDRSQYWIAKIVHIKADSKAGIIKAGNSPGKSTSHLAHAAGPIVLRVQWFWRLRDFKGVKGGTKIAQKLAAYGFKTEIVDEADQQYRLQDRELIATNHTDLIPLESVAGRVDVFHFDDSAKEPDEVYAEQISPKSDSQTDQADRTGISNYYYRLEWPVGAKDWNPRLPGHCFCGRHYDPAQKQVYCPHDRKWFHASCLLEKGSHAPTPAGGIGGDVAKGNGKRGRDADADGGKSKKVRIATDGTKEVPEDVRTLAGSSVTRGGDGGLLAGNFEIVLRAQSLVKDFENGEESQDSCEDLETDLQQYRQDEQYVRSFTRAVGGTKAGKGKGKKTQHHDEELEDGRSFKCPTCESLI